MDSKWAVKQKGESEALFTTRDSVVNFMESLLRHKMFHRAKIVVVQKSEKKKKGDDESAVDEPSKKSKKSKEINDGNESEKKDDDTKKEKVEKKKKEKKGKKKIKLDMHMEQIFVDGKEVSSCDLISRVLIHSKCNSPMFGSMIQFHLKLGLSDLEWSSELSWSAYSHCGRELFEHTCTI